MGEGTEGPPRTVACLLDIVAFCRLVDFWVELLFRACVAVRAGISLFAVGGVTPLVIQLHIGAWSRPEGEGREGGGEGKKGGY